MSIDDQKTKSMNDILTEKELLDLLGIKKAKLDDLRRRHRLPFCKLSNASRIYLVSDVLGFIENRRMILNQADTD